MRISILGLIFSCSLWAGYLQAQQLVHHRNGTIDQLYFHAQSDSTLVWTDRGQIDELSFQDPFYEDGKIGFILKTKFSQEIHLLENKSEKWITLYSEILHSNTKSKAKLTDTIYRYALEWNLTLAEYKTVYYPEFSAQVNQCQYDWTGEKKSSPIQFYNSNFG